MSGAEWRISDSSDPDSSRNAERIEVYEDENDSIPQFALHLGEYRREVLEVRRMWRAG